MVLGMKLVLINLMIIAVMVEICHPLITSHEPKFEVCTYQRYSIGDYGK